MINSFQGEYRFLSNFYPSRVKLLGVTYPTVEHAYQSAKSSDEAYKKKILACTRPGEAKRLGKTVELPEGWEVAKVIIMKDLLEQKFSNSLLRRWLLETGDEQLIEGNKHGDVFWGFSNGRGQNWLGKLLMTVREDYPEYTEL